MLRSLALVYFRVQIQCDQFDLLPLSDFVIWVISLFLGVLLIKLVKFLLHCDLFLKDLSLVHRMLVVWIWEVLVLKVDVRCRL